MRMGMAPTIPVEEYAQRRERAAAMLAHAGFDVLVANGTESDPSVVRYFSAYWPLFEMGGVAIAPSGESALMVGMESSEFAKARGLIDNVHTMKEYRETADPVYPGVAGSSYREVFESIGVRDPGRIGVAGYLCTNMAMYEGLREAYPQAQIVNADELTAQLRARKSAAELACLREGFRLGELALQAMLDVVRPGMTELELAGVAIAELYRQGAECEAHTVYSFGGRKTSNAISRGTHRRLEKGDIVQINVGGRVDGYSPSVGRPICLGPMSERQRRLIEFCRDMHERTFEWVQAGVVAKDVAIRYEEFVQAAGMGRHYLYGPCTGLGLMEVEKPWMEAISEYTIEPGMTFQADTFFHDDDFGCRWENGLLVRESGPAEMINSGAHMELIEIDC
jgi:Xaa-Pro aminopeptidase